MSARMATLLCVVLAASPAPAQISPPPGSLQLPPRGAQAPAPPRPPAAPSAAPRSPVQQVAPLSSPTLTPPRTSLGRPAPAASKPPVLVARGGAQRATPLAVSPKPGAAQMAAGAAVAGAAVAASPGPAASGSAASAPAASAPAASGSASAAPASAGPRPPPEPSTGTVTGQKLPRWAGILYDGVRLRVGPGQRYPVEWIYRRPDQPVRVLREFETWRLIEDHEGVRGWVHQSNLTGRRTFMVPGAERTLRRSAVDDAGAVAVLKPGVVGRIRGCPEQSAWCEVRVGDHRGWLRRDGLWGLSPGEKIGN